MVIKKPYAFLIKNFKLIHVILFVLMCYMAVVTFNIFDFFNTYASNNSIYSIELVSSYINLFVFLDCIIVIAASLVVYYLFSQKKKSNKLYMFICLFYFLLCVYYIVCIVWFQKLEYTNFNFEKARIIRDVCVMFLAPQVVFSVFVLTRALGFNIKEFDFKKDLDELKIEDNDSEEVEVSFNLDNYKYKRAFRKTIRLFKYFLLENRFFITMACSVFALVISLVVFLNLRVYNIHYVENKEFVANSVFYTATDSYIAYKDIYGNIINDGKIYLLIKMKLRNKININLNIDRNTFRLKMGNELLVPKFSFGEQFLDVGEVFSKATLSSGEEKEILIVFELTEAQYKNEYILRVKNANNLSIGDLQSEYVDLVIKPVNINKNADFVSYDVPGEIDMSNTILGKTILTTDSYEISDTFKEKYQNCVNDLCNTYTYVVNPSGKGNAILKIKSTIIVDESIYISKYIKYPSNFYKYFTKIKFRVEGVNTTLKSNVIDSKYGMTEYTYIEVPESISKANKIEILIDIRGVKYNLLLK